MTATVESAPESTPSYPPGRYGRRREGRRPRRWIAGTLTLLVVAAGVAVALRMESVYGSEYDSKLMAYKIGDGYVEVTFAVTKPEGEGATCRVRSRNFEGAEIGHADVVVPAGEARTVEYTYRLPVTGEPNTGEVQRCWPTD
ncbi:DUF4307 domain-containing protein [Salininema proteolyticum]|uniref:DUF4307 domain-containing protein n=1 Tax=Salininema proteolyticum TaxID=1607685 RepID=A0ABV8TZ54_9ACTN